MQQFNYVPISIKIGKKMFIKYINDLKSKHVKKNKKSLLASSLLASGKIIA